MRFRPKRKEHTAGGSNRRQRQLNLETRDGWHTFAPHREHVTELLVRAGDGGRLAVLGAGNCNDLDLGRLLAHYEQVTLVDVDRESLREGIRRQGLEPGAALRLRAPVDAGSGDAARQLVRGGAVTTQTVARSRAHAISDAPFDVVASTCLLTQLILARVAEYGQSHPRCLDLVQLERSVHLQLLSELVRPGGRAALVSDLVSSDTAPHLLGLAQAELPDAMRELVSQHNFFTGLNPYVIVEQLRTEASYGADPESITLHAPWLWPLTNERGYLVFAISFVRR
jgi:hypothetical protein